MTSTTDEEALPPIDDAFYPDPEWARLPPKEWTLVEIKGGVEMSKTPLHKRRSWLMGRAADQVHIPMAHPSLSRCHARIAFDAQGIPWLRDCQSTHGTFVNKKKLPPQAVGTIETNSNKPGSRGVMLYPGDVLQLGASTRLYCVEGPPEFQRGSIRVVAPPKPRQSQTTTTTPIQGVNDEEEEKEEEEHFVSWGISMDEAGDFAEKDEYNAEAVLARQQALENSDAIPDKHRKSWEKIAALKYKLKNLLTESDRIRRKGEDLTEGQERQLQRNQQRTQELQEKIEERERDLYDKLHPEQASGTKRKKRHHALYEDDDDDDFFDRTKDASRQNDDEQQEGETEGSLKLKWKELQQRAKTKQLALDKSSQRVERFQQRLDRLKADGDDEAFFAKNDLTLAQDQHQKILQDVDSVDQEKMETKRLLKIVNPRIVLRDEDEDGASSLATTISMAPPPRRKMIVDASEDASAVMPPPSSKTNSAVTETGLSQELKESATGSETVESSGFMMPPPKRKRVVGPAGPPSPDYGDNDQSADRQAKEIEKETVDSSDTKSNNSSRKGKVKGPSRPPAVMGTLAALTASASKGSKTSVATNSGESSSAEKHKEPAAKIDLKEDVWQAPKDQDGSGVTKLNAKFAGRY